MNVHALFERLRKQGELTLIGAETSIVENKCKRCDGRLYTSAERCTSSSHQQGL